MKIAGKIALVSVTLNGIIFSILVDPEGEQSSIDTKGGYQWGISIPRHRADSKELSRPSGRRY